MERGEDGGSEQTGSGSLNVGQILALAKILKEEPMLLDSIQLLMKALSSSSIQLLIKALGITSVPQLMRVAEDICRIAVNEGTQSIEEKLLTEAIRAQGNDLPKEGSLLLKFSDEVSDTMTDEMLKFSDEVSDTMTDEKLKGIKDESLELYLVDTNGHIVTCGDESSAMVEMILLDDNGGDDENGITRENLAGRIIEVGKKKKPHFAKRFDIQLKNGVGDLSDLKLGHDRDRIKLWKCRLGARIAQNLGITVQEAWTEPFEVIDKCDRHFKKCDTPSPDSQVWKLKKIGRDGKPYRRLKDKNIKTVLDFLFWFSVNPKELQVDILGATDSRWKTAHTHAQDCNINDKKMYYHKSSNEPQMLVIYDAVGELKGIIDNTHFVPIDNLSDNKKVDAHKVLRSLLEPSAFVQRYKTFFNDEASLLQQFPCRSSDIDDYSYCSSIQQFFNCNDLTRPETIHGYQSIISTNICDTESDPCLFPAPTAPEYLGDYNMSTVEDMERMYDDYDHAQRCSSSSSGFFEGVEDDMKRRFSRVWQETYGSTKWNRLWCVMKWCFSRESPPRLTRKRKR